jgi:hypothetical protein
MIITLLDHKYPKETSNNIFFYFRENLKSYKLMYEDVNKESKCLPIFYTKDVFENILSFMSISQIKNIEYFYEILLFLYKNEYIGENLSDKCVVVINNYIAINEKNSKLKILTLGNNYKNLFIDHQNTKIISIDGERKYGSIYQHDLCKIIQNKSIVKVEDEDTYIIKYFDIKFKLISIDGIFIRAENY